MKTTQQFIVCAIALATMTVSAASIAAEAKVGATVSAANMYYWRGHDLKGGAAVSGDLNISYEGFIAGIWTSSGDETMGTESDIYVGYSGSVRDFTYGLTFINYVYPNPKSEEWEPVEFGDYLEVAPSLGYGPLKVTYYDAINADHPYFSEDYSYTTVELTYEKFAFKYGLHNDKSGYYDGISHIDATYKFNDKLSFTLGKIISDNESKITGEDGEIEVINAAPEEVNFVVTLALPIM